MSDCKNCKYAIMDYQEYYGGIKECFVEGCEMDMPGEEECEEFVEVNE